VFVVAGDAGADAQIGAALDEEFADFRVDPEIDSIVTERACATSERIP
jgi:hypothetical protein